MRKQTAVDLGHGQTAIVRELRVRDMRALLERAESLAALKDLPLPELLRDHLPDLLALVEDSLQLPTGAVVDDLSLSECEALGRAWWELHKGFFSPLVRLAAAQVPELGAMVRAHSSAPVSSAPSADMAPSGTTAGPST
jgi:hypothetical protein